MTYFKENASRHNVLPTLSTQTSKVSDSMGLHEMPAVQAPYFYPARDGSNQKCPYLHSAQDGGRTQDQDGNTNREAKRRSTCKVTQRNAQQPPHARASSTKDHAAPNPRSRDRAAGQKDKPEPPGEKQKMSTNRGSPNDTSGEEQPDCDTHQDCATHGEASEHIGIHISSNAHPDCVKGDVKNPHGVTEHEGEPACDTHRERRQEKGRFQQPQALPDEGCRCLANQRTKAPYLYPARDGGNNQPRHENKSREPRACTPPGTAATSINQKYTQNSKWISKSMQTHKSPTRSGKGQRKPPPITKADEPTRSRQLQEPTNSRKKCLANPQRESALTKQDMNGKQQRIDQLPVAATTDRTPPHATAITHQDARNHGATTQSSIPQRKVNHTRSFPWTTTFGDARDAVLPFFSRHI